MTRSSFGEVDDRPIANSTVFVHDPVLNIDRRIVAGQPVPNDLREAYDAATAPKAKAKASSEDKTASKPDED